MNVPTETDLLVQRTDRALSDRSLNPADLERLLARATRQRRIDVGGVLRALGVLAAVAGVALAYIVNYGSMSEQVAQWTPFAFPTALLAGAVVLSRSRRPAWEVDLAAVVGEVTLAVMMIAAAGAWHFSREYGQVCGAVSLATSLLVYRVLRMTRLATWGAAASLAALMQFFGSNESGHSVAQTFLVEAAVAALVGFCLVRTSRAVSAQALYLATLLGLFGGIAGVAADSFAGPGISGWTVALFLTTLLALATAALLELNGLLWLGTLGSLLTLAAVGDATRHDQHWAYVVVAIGIALAALGTVLHRSRRPPRLIGGPAAEAGGMETPPPNR